MTTLCAPSMDAQAREKTWLCYVNDFSSDITMWGLARMMESLTNDIHRKGVRTINLTHISRESPSPQHLVAFLRMTYVFKDKLQGWYELRDFAVSYLPQHRYDPQRVMHGLLW